MSPFSEQILSWPLNTARAVSRIKQRKDARLRRDAVRAIVPEDDLTTQRCRLALARVR